MIYMRRITWTAAILLCFSLVLAACGKKDAESVVKDLDKHVNSLESYQASGTMTLRTGQQPLEYKVEVSYQKPEYYRIKLTNEEKDITQIVLRNDDGVFVLTPKLNKVFRFQSDWPQNQGQVYLYQTLVKSILLDNSRQFVIDENAYVFDVMANYNNGSLARQKIWLNKSDYKPVQVEVSDANAAVMVEVKFDNFEFGPKFEKTVFETEANMQAAPSSQSADEPTMTLPEQDPGNTGAENDGEDAEDEATAPGDDANAPDDEQGDDAAAEPEAETTSELGAMAPSYTPQGVTQLDMVDIVFGGNAGLMTRYTGDYSYTLIQTEPKDMATSLTEGRTVDLVFTIGKLSGGVDQQTLTWIYAGHQFRLTSDNLPESEMIKIAQSVQGEIDK
jgi:outer membrane lipoprotein-sorting protein